jgi:hypothetical protein
MPHPLAWLPVLAAIALVSCAFTVLAHWARASQRWPFHFGWSITAGLFAGILLGPTVFGRIFPDHYERWLIGGVELRQARDSLMRRHGAEMLVAEHSRLDPGEVQVMHDEHDLQSANLERDLGQARWRHQAPLRGFTMVVIALVLLASGRHVIRQPRGQNIAISAFTAGIWSAAVPAGLACLVALWWWQLTLESALMLGASVAIGPWALTPFDRRAADRSEVGGARLVQAAGRISSVIAMAMAGMSLWLTGGLTLLVYGAPLLALPVAWVIGDRRRDTSAANPRSKRHAQGFSAIDLIMHLLLMPTLAACVSIRLDLLTDVELWPAVLLPLISDDGRWLGAFCGTLILGGRPVLRTMRLVMGTMAAGPTQLAIAALVAHTHALAPAALLGLALGSLLMESTAPLRRKMAVPLLGNENSP